MARVLRIRRLGIVTTILLIVLFGFYSLFVENLETGKIDVNNKDANKPSRSTSASKVARRVYELIREEDRILQESGQISTECSAKFGLGFIQEWRNYGVTDHCHPRHENDDEVQSNSTCRRYRGSFSVPIMLCNTVNASIYPSKLPHIGSADGKMLTERYEKGGITAYCEQPDPPVIPQEAFVTTVRDYFVRSFEAKNTKLSCPAGTLDYPIYLLKRYDFRNPFHFLEDLSWIFISLAVFHDDILPDIGDFQFALQDDMALGDHLELIETFSSGRKSIIFQNDSMKDGTCVPQVFGNIHAGVSLLSNGGVGHPWHCISPILRALSEFLLQHHLYYDSKSASTRLPLKGKRKTILWVVRASKEKQSSWQENRRLHNQDGIIQSLFQRLSTDPRARLEIGDFGGMTGIEQMHLAHEADILIGVHGAGLTHQVWMPRWRPDLPDSQRSTVIELFPPGYRGNYHFYNIAKMMGHRYESMDISLSVNIDSIWSKLDVILTEMQ